MLYIVESGGLSSPNRINMAWYHTIEKNHSRYTLLVYYTCLPRAKPDRDLEISELQLYLAEGGLQIMIWAFSGRVLKL